MTYPDYFNFILSSDILILAIVLAVAFGYVFYIRPNLQRKKELEEQLTNSIKVVPSLEAMMHMFDDLKISVQDKINVLLQNQSADTLKEINILKVDLKETINEVDEIVKQLSKTDSKIDVIDANIKSMIRSMMALTNIINNVINEIEKYDKSISFDKTSLDEMKRCLETSKIDVNAIMHIVQDILSKKLENNKIDCFLND